MRRMNSKCIHKFNTFRINLFNLLFATSIFYQKDNCEANTQTNKQTNK